MGGREAWPRNDQTPTARTESVIERQGQCLTPDLNLRDLASVHVNFRSLSFGGELGPHARHLGNNLASAENLQLRGSIVNLNHVPARLLFRYGRLWSVEIHETVLLWAAQIGIANYSAATKLRHCFLDRRNSHFSSEWHFKARKTELSEFPAVSESFSRTRVFRFSDTQPSF